MKRFDFSHLGKQKALVPYLSAGDPDPEQTVAIMHALVRAGANALELGIPFSDPGADGKVIQEAHERALARGVDFAAVLSMARAFRQQDAQTPLIAMGYLNSLERRGFATAAQQLAAAGFDGIILVDCPLEALPDYYPALKEAQLQPVLLAAPTTSPSRLKAIAAQAQGFIYCISLRGVTGRARSQQDDIGDLLRTLREARALPRFVGFGISDAASARRAAREAEGVVIGSALVRALHQCAEQGGDLPACAEAFLAPIRAALDDKEV